jgi:hypothetical protein
MTTTTMNGAGSTARAQASSGTVTRVTHLDEILGGHPGALRAIYEEGRAARPEELVGSWSGRFLALEPARDVAALMRPVFQALRGGAPLWQGAHFFADGTGANRTFRGNVWRFGIEAGFSELDGAPAAILRYDLPQHRNSWPVRNARDELRFVGHGVALGPMLLSATAGGRRVVVAWFGLQREG